MTEHYIREMRDSDWERVKDIYSYAITEGNSTFHYTCPCFNEWNFSHLPECRYVTVCDEKVVGWCALSPTSAREAYRGVVEVSIYFDKDYRHNGLGEELLRYLISESEKHGFWCLYSAIFEINTASIGLHKKCGFREVGYREKIARDIFGEWQNTVILERRNSIE